MIDKFYLEITDVCNFDCSFCHKTSRPKKLMTMDEYQILTDKLIGKIQYLYFHLMGEPTLHPLLPQFIKIAKEKGFIPMLTTNGSLLHEKGPLLLDNLPHKISISLHAPDANPKFADPQYLVNCSSFARQAAEKGCYVSLRLWNLGSGVDNSNTLDVLHNEFPDEWVPIRGGPSLRLMRYVFLEWGDQFEWPDIGRKQCDADSDVFCYALRNHVAALVDGTVVPCCLDADGNIPLGNLFTDDLDEILSSPRAKKIYDGFTRRRASEALCRTCGFVEKFKRG